MTERKRKQIARNFLYETFGFGCVELWRNYKSMIGLEARAFMPIPCPYIHDSGEPYIGGGETKEEALEIMKLESSQEKIDAGVPEIEEYKGYWIVLD